MDSHHKMIPPSRIRHVREAYLKSAKPRQAAVLNLFYPGEDRETRLLLILRKSYKGVHSNQVGFPGGKVERSDRDLEDTALRETHEEVGVHPEKVNIIRSLSEVYIPPSNFMVYPYMGYSEERLRFIRQETEVERLIEVRLEEFLSDKAMFYQRLDTSYAADIEVPAFRLNDYTVWGATAMILSEVKELLNTRY
ncbi:NUDIX hydrolase [Robertkochia flava]|uniref:NUDIX hydrolase n=1 Tax=Robertkochia flava TaxID=3447986 RepID=UPI00293D6D83|nr:CoA pyrophosphatase [Robertkochia marina]